MNELDALIATMKSAEAQKASLSLEELLGFMIWLAEIIRKEAR